MCCFSAVPLRQFPDLRKFRPHLARWDFEATGISIRRAALEKLGIRPVQYRDSGISGSTPDPGEPWIVSGKEGAWTREMEWRIDGDVDLRRLGPDDAVVFVSDAEAARQVRRFSRWPVVILQTTPDSIAETPPALAQETLSPGC